MALGLKPGQGPRLSLKLRPVGHALLIHPKGQGNQRSQLIAERLVPDSTHNLVVIDLPPGSLDQEWETVARLLADHCGGVRLVYGRGGQEKVHTVGQRLADRLGRPVLAPDGEPLLTPGGQLYIPSEHGAGWLRFRPGRTVERESRRYPRARWEFSVPDSPQEISPHGVAEPLPSGVWVRSTADLLRNTHRQRLMQVLPTHPDILTVVIGSPGAPEVSLEDVVRLWESVLPTARSLARFVHYGPVALPDGQSLGQALADALEQQVVLYGGVPVEAAAGFGLSEIRCVRADGWLSGRPFITGLAYAPAGEGESAPPALYGLRAPLAGLRQLSYGVYDYAPDAVLEIVQSGLWVRPPGEPAGGDDVRRTPAEPGSPLILFDRDTAENTERMRSLAQDMLWRLEPEVRETYRVAPADDPGSVRAAPREAVTYTPTEQESWDTAGQGSWDAAAAAAPPAAAHPAAPGTADRPEARTAADSGDRRAGHPGAAPVSPAVPAAPSGVRGTSRFAPADAGDRATSEAGSAIGPSRPRSAVRPVPPTTARPLMESGPGEPGLGVRPDEGGTGEPAAGPGQWSPVRGRVESGPAGSGPAVDVGARESGSPLPTAVRALMESGPGEPGPGARSDGGGAGESGAGETGEADASRAGDAGQGGKPRGRLLRRLSARTPRLVRRPQAGADGSAPGASGTGPRAESGPAGSGPAADAGGGGAREAGSPVPSSAVRAEAGSGPAEPGPGTRADDGAGGEPVTGGAGKAGGPETSETDKGGESGTGGPKGAEPEGDASEADAAKSGKASAAESGKAGLGPVGPGPAGSAPAAPAGGSAPRETDVTGNETGAAGRDEAAAPPRTEAEANPAPQTTGADGAHGAGGPDAQTPEPEAPAAAGVPAAGAPRPVRTAAPRVRLESGAPDAPGLTPTGTDTPASPPASRPAPPGSARPDAPEQGAPATGPATRPAAPAVPPGEGKPQATASAAGSVTVQPVPKAAACAVPPKRGLEQERTWVRKSLSERYNAAASEISGVLAGSPGLRGRAGADAAEALTDLVAVRLYLFGDSRGLDTAVRRARVGPHVPLARCVASGLRRLPSYRGPALLHARLGDAERAWYREGRLATEWAFCSARTNPYTGPKGTADFLIWSLTARRTSLVDPGTPDRVLFLPGTSFKVLRVHTGKRHAVLLRELSSSEIAGDGRVKGQRTSLDEIALNGLEQTLKALTDTGSRGAPSTPAGSVGSPPGLIVPTGGSRPRTTADQAQRRKAAKK